MDAVHHRLLQTSHQSAAHLLHVSLPPLHLAVEDPIIPKVREPALRGHIHLAKVPGRIAPCLESAVERDIGIRKEPAANLIPRQQRLSRLPVHHGIEFSVYPVDVAPPLVIVHHIGDSGLFLHHISHVPHGKAAQFAHFIIIFDNRKLLLLSIVLVRRKLLRLPMASHISHPLHLPPLCCH